MGGILSRRAGKSDFYEFPQGETSKRQRISSSFYEESPRLIPSLPDEISIQILARLPRICYMGLKLVSRSWKSVIVNDELYKIRKELSKTEEWLYILTKGEDDKLMWYALDPVYQKWQRLPLMPNIAEEEGSKGGPLGLWMWNMVGSSIRIADAIREWLGRKDRSNRVPFCGCAVGAISGCIYVLGGFSRASAMSGVWCYDPILNKWRESSPMSVGRAYCKTGVLNKKLYVVGGVTINHGGLTPLQSAEVFDPCTGIWSQVPNMPFSKAQVLPTAFLAHLLKPIATGMTSYRGKLYVPQSLYCLPFFVDVGGEVYDPETNSWLEMPMGMGEGWPAKQAGTKLSVVVDGELYALDPSSSLDSAKVKKYDHEDDSWKLVEGDVPIHDFADSEAPYLLGSFVGKLHVITKDANHNISVLQAERQNNLTPLPSTSSTLSADSPNPATSSTLSANSSNPASSSTHSADSPNLARSEKNTWKVISTRCAGSDELVNCQVLDI